SVNQSEDYSKLALLEAERLAGAALTAGPPLQAAGAGEGRDLAWCSWTGELIVATAGQQLHRLNHGAGPLSCSRGQRRPQWRTTGAAECPQNGLLFVGTDDAKVQAWDRGPRPPWPLWTSGPRDHVTFRRWHATGHALIYDIRERRPCVVKDHRYGVEEQERTETVLYDNYKFLTREQLTSLGLSSLIGTEYLRAFMHGFFIDSASTSAQSAERSARRLTALPLVGFDEPRLRRSRRSRRRRRRGQALSALVTDARFGDMFRREEFAVDAESEEFWPAGPAAFGRRLKKRRSGGNGQGEGRPGGEAGGTANHQSEASYFIAAAPAVAEPVAAAPVPQQPLSLLSRIFGGSRSVGGRLGPAGNRYFEESLGPEAAAPAGSCGRPARSGTTTRTALGGRRACHPSGSPGCGAGQTPTAAEVAANARLAELKICPRRRNWRAARSNSAPRATPRRGGAAASGGRQAGGDAQRLRFPLVRARVREYPGAGWADEPERRRKK
uniref:NUC153 domain-containing protein n=1 Tax=Macrostomum lignano TaxID=282301 RepID=A0A1I8FDR8_9PLAT